MRGRSGSLALRGCRARGRSVIVLERNDRAGEETSSRNSGVIHAGLYYEPGSWKARTCVEGRERLYARCARDGVPHLRCGKLVVAQDDEERGGSKRSTRAACKTARVRCA